MARILILKSLDWVVSRQTELDYPSGLTPQMTSHLSAKRHLNKSPYPPCLFLTEDNGSCCPPSTDFGSNKGMLCLLPKDIGLYNLHDLDRNTHSLVERIWPRVSGILPGCKLQISRIDGWVNWTISVHFVKVNLIFPVFQDQYRPSMTINKPSWTNCFFYNHQSFIQPSS